MLVLVFGNISLNPDAVGKLELAVENKDYVRKTITRVWDLTGQHLLLEASTVISTDDDAKKRDPLAVDRDNTIHDEIRLALHERRDAATWSEIDAVLTTQL